MKPTPMSAFRSAPATARVLPPPNTPAEPKHLIQLRQLIAQGHSPAAAMARIERGDGHSGRIPITTNTENCGGRGNKRPKHIEPLTTRIIAKLTREWQPVNDAFAAAVGSRRENISASLRDMRDAGRVEYLRMSGNRKSLWRVKA